MTYNQLKQAIRHEQKINDGYEAYITCTDKETLQSNFIEHPAFTDNQLIKAVNEGLLSLDLDTYLVIK